MLFVLYREKVLGKLREGAKPMTKQVKDAELEIQNKISLSIDDFEDVDFWKTLLKRLDVPQGSEEIFFKAQDVTYSN